MDEEVKRVRSCQNHYEVLGVERNAQEADIKKAYRRLALKLHPDKNHAQFAEEAFKAVAEAEACLGNSVRRKKYDALLREGGDGRGSALDFGERRRSPAHPPAAPPQPSLPLQSARLWLQRWRSLVRCLWWTRGRSTEAMGCRVRAQGRTWTRSRARLWWRRGARYCSCPSPARALPAAAHAVYRISRAHAR
jgi:curved DNA-binding protein CbpA|eukprot:COSAG06_NODE_525_length_14684_cov_64.439150_7_plen_192_part_00